MCDKKNIIFHVGYPKTATTSLQNRVFPKLNGILYLGKFYERVSGKTSIKPDWLKKLIHLLSNNDTDFFEDYRLSDNISTPSVKAQHQNNSKLLISDELFLYSCLGPGYYLRNAHCISTSTLFQRIRLITNERQFNQIKVIIVIRKQDDLLESLYAEAYNWFLKLGFKKVEQLADFVINKETGLPIESVLHFDRVCDEAESIFGIENVLILVYEELRDNPEDFLQRLVDFLDTKTDIEALVKQLSYAKHNVRRYQDLGIKINKESNHNSFRRFFSRIKVFFFGSRTSLGIGKQLRYIESFLAKVGLSNDYIKLSDETKRSVLKHFEESNKQLLKKVPSIMEYGYFN